MSIRRFSTSSLTTGSKSSKFWDQETLPGAFESIAAAVVDASGSSTVTFSNIPQNYAHLQIRLFARSTTAAGNSNAYIQFNGVTSAAYSYHELTGSGGTAGSAGSASVTGPRICSYPAASSTVSTFGAGIIDILDYANTSKNTTYRSLNGNDQNGSGYVILFSGAWYNTDAVTSILIGDNSGGNFVQYTHAALYGIRGA
jgi:hypothetical protein